MAAVNPVPVQSTATASAGYGASQEISSTFEQKMLDYIAAHQAEGLAKGQHLGNPAALGGEALKGLKGYFERANSLQDVWARKAKIMNKDGEAIPADGGMMLTSLPGGPASERMESIDGKKSAGERIQSISDADLDRTVEVMVQVTQLMNFGVETSMVTNATHSASQSVMTLIRGQ